MEYFIDVVEERHYLITNSEKKRQWNFEDSQYFKILGMIVLTYYSFHSTISLFVHSLICFNIDLFEYSLTH